MYIVLHLETHILHIFVLHKISACPYIYKSTFFSYQNFLHICLFTKLKTVPSKKQECKNIYQTNQNHLTPVKTEDNRSKVESLMLNPTSANQYLMPNLSTSQVCDLNPSTWNYLVKIRRLYA